MRKVSNPIRENQLTEVHCLDEPGAGGACHKYIVVEKGIVEKGIAFGCKPGDPVPLIFGDINFQNGPVNEMGVNGCHQEDLMAIIIDRLEGFQSGDYACHENQKALDAAYEVVFWLNKRTAERERRGVAGTDIK